MEVHNAPERDMDHVIRYYARLFHNRRLGGHLSLSFYIQFFKQHVNIILQQALASAIEKKIVLVSDACSRPPIIIRSHNLHIGDIKRAMGEITPTTKGINFLPFFGSCGLFIFWPFFGLPFLSPMSWFWPSIFYWIPLFILDLVFVKQVISSTNHE